MPGATEIAPAQVRAFRVDAQQLERKTGTLADTALFELGVQDTGSAGARWALANRGLAEVPAAELVLAWTWRGAPHFSRRSDLSKVAVAVQPWSEEDASKRVFDASKPLKAAGIGTLEALDVVAAALHAAVATPTVKGEVSGALARQLPEPYLRYCRPCQATHLYEMPFRLGALRGGVELAEGTSPPVLRRIPRFRLARTVPERFDPIRAYLRLLGPATPALVAAYLDAPVKEVTARWPDDAVEVRVGGQKRWILDEDVERLADAPAPSATRLIGAYDLFLQGKDRELVTEDPAQVKALWPVLGRPGAVLASGEVVGLWRPRAQGKRLSLQVEPWRTWSGKLRKAVAQQAERLAEFRGSTLASLAYPD